MQVGSIKDVFEGICFRVHPRMMMPEVVMQLLYGVYYREAHLFKRRIPLLWTTSVLR